MNLSETLHIIIDSLGYILPEVCLAIGALLILVVELFYQNSQWKAKTVLNVLLLMITGYLIYSIPDQKSFNGLLINDNVSTFFKYLFLLVLALVQLFPKSENRIKSKGEYHFLLLSIALGAFLVVQSLNLLVFYLSLELISLSSYILTTFSFKKRGYEAGIKYLLFGALSSGVMLYGISLLYGLSGSLDIEVVMQTVFSSSTILGWLSILFFVSGVLFKVSLVPMHIWTPDVYEAAPTSVVTVFSVVPKLAALVFLYRISDVTYTGNVNWTNLLALIAMASMFLGNLSAIWQNNAKRMMAYSSIAHAGFLLIGVIVNSEFGLQSLLFYCIVYAIMNIGVFYFIHMMENNGIRNIKEYAGLGRKFPLLGVVVVVLMISLTGLPPTGGFTAKLLVFSALWEYYSVVQTDVVLWLFILGLANAVLALFYYLKIPYFMFFKTSDKRSDFKFSTEYKIFLSVMATLILVLFFRADWLIAFI